MEVWTPNSGTFSPDRLPAHPAGSKLSLPGGIIFTFTSSLSGRPLIVSSISLPSLVPWRTTTSEIRFFKARTMVRFVENIMLVKLIIIIICSENCIRGGKGYCRIQWQSNAATTPNSFQLDATAGTEATTALNACPLSYVEIPNGSQNGQTALNSGLSPLAFQSVWCGDELGISGQSVGSSIVCKSTNN